MALNQVPQTGQSLAQTRDAIRNNFGTIDSGFSVNHGSFGGPNVGFHEFVTLVDRTGSTPSFGGRNGIWSETFATTNKTEIWVNAKAGGGINQYPMTASIMSTNPNQTNFPANGWTYLPSGIVWKWGLQSVATTASVNLDAIGPVYGAIYSVQLTSTNNGVVHSTGSTSSSLSITRDSGATSNVYWFTIGRE